MCYSTLLEIGLKFWKVNLANFFNQDCIVPVNVIGHTNKLKFSQFYFWAFGFKPPPPPHYPLPPKPLLWRFQFSFIAFEIPLPLRISRNLPIGGGGIELLSWNTHFSHSPGVTATMPTNLIHLEKTLLNVLCYLFFFTVFYLLFWQSMITT